MNSLVNVISLLSANDAEMPTWVVKSFPVIKIVLAVFWRWLLPVRHFFLCKPCRVLPLRVQKVNASFICNLPLRKRLSRKMLPCGSFLRWKGKVWYFPAKIGKKRLQRSCRGIKRKYAFKRKRGEVSPIIALPQIGKTAYKSRAFLSICILRSMEKIAPSAHRLSLVDFKKEGGMYALK